MTTLPCTRWRMMTLVGIGLAAGISTHATEPAADPAPGATTGTEIITAITLDERIVRASRGNDVSPEISESLGLPVSAAQTPLTVASITEGLNITQGNSTLRDSLRNVSGVNVGVGNGIHDFFVIRGVDSLNGGLILTDGVPEPEVGFYPMHNIREIQVIKGPANFAHGANSLAGSVNMLRKKPIADDFAEVRVGVGSHDTHKVSVDAGRGSENNANGARINALYEDGESHRDNIESTFVAVNPSFMWSIDENARITVHFDYQDSDVTPDAGVPLLGPVSFTDSRSANYGLPGDFSEQEIMRLMALYERDISDNVTLRNKSYFTDFSWESQGTVYAGFVLFGLGLEGAPDTLSRFRPTLNDEQEIFGNELEVSIHSDTDLGENELVLGGEFTRLTDTFTITTPQASDVSVSSGVSFPGVTLPLVPDNVGDAETDIIAAYAADHLQVSDTVTLTAGGRVEWMDFEDSARGTSKSETLFSPFGGVTVDAHKDMTLYANASVGYAPPSTQVAGPRGSAEEGRAIEGGLRFTCPLTAWKGNVAIYQLEREDIAVPTSSGLSSESGSQTSQGIEVDLVGNITDEVTLRVAYGYLDSELDSFAEFTALGLSDRSGNTAPFAPEHILQVWGEYAVDEHWTVGLGGRSVSEQYIAPDNAYQIDNYVSLDAALIYRQPTWDVALHLNNITDEEIDTRGVAGTSVIPEDEFNVMATLGIRL